MRRVPSSFLWWTLNRQRFGAARALWLQAMWALAEVNAALGARVQDGVRRRIPAHHGS
jgi:hypothetical protein